MIVTAEPLDMDALRSTQGVLAMPGDRKVRRWLEWSVFDPSS